MRIELMEADLLRDVALWTGGGVGEDEAIRTIAGVTLARTTRNASDQLYTQNLGFQDLGSDGARRRFMVGDGSGIDFVDVIAPDTPGQGRMGAGTIHHVAFRTSDDASQSDWLKTITRLGLHVSPVMDRKYFHSIYFREPSGILFEIATDGPGMAVDEPAAALGETLMLPAQFESARQRIESSLPAIHQPHFPPAADVLAGAQ